jgi:hypothetical protein
MILRQTRINLGFSYVYDDYDETLDSSDYLRRENVPEIFEYTFRRLRVWRWLRASCDFQTSMARALRKISICDMTFHAPHCGYRPARGFARQHISEKAGLMSISRRWVCTRKTAMRGAWNYGVNVSAFCEAQESRLP